MNVGVGRLSRGDLIHSDLCSEYVKLAMEMTISLIKTISRKSEEES